LPSFGLLLLYGVSPLWPLKLTYNQIRRLAELADFFPFFFPPSVWSVAVTRIQDHRHHIRDVIVGSLIGISSASIAYLFYFPSPFNGSLLGLTMGKPRLVYDHDTLPRKLAIRGQSSSRVEEHVSGAAAV
jgi:membrane-associated phospholipid phosphatase